MRPHESSLLCHLEGTSRSEKRIPDGSGNTIVLQYVWCERCNRKLDKREYLETS